MEISKEKLDRKRGRIDKELENLPLSKLKNCHIADNNH